MAYAPNWKQQERERERQMWKAWLMADFQQEVLKPLPTYRETRYERCDFIGTAPSCHNRTIYITHNLLPNLRRGSTTSSLERHRTLKKVC
jgi:hypothetical protein